MKISMRPLQRGWQLCSRISSHVEAGGFNVVSPSGLILEIMLAAMLQYARDAALLTIAFTETALKTLLGLGAGRPGFIKFF
jgi:hypothetical protein